MPKSAPAPKKPRDRSVFNARLVTVIAIVTLCAVAWVTFDRPGNAEAGTKVVAPKFSVDSSPEMQLARAESIDKLISSGVFDKVDKPVKRPHVYVSDRWHALTVEEKGTTLGVVLAYYHVIDPRADMVVIRDAATGERIGMFSEHGLELD